MKSRAADPPSARSHRYLVAVLLTASGLVTTVALEENGTETLSPLIGAVAISCWYGGVGPGLVSITLSWSVAWAALVRAATPWEIPARGELLRWLVPLGVSLIIVWVSWALRRAGTRATVRAESAERERRMTESVQQLTSELSSAVSPSDVAHTLVERLPALLGSTGAAVGLVEGNELRIVDPAGASLQTLEPGLSLLLDEQAPITTAARTGELAVVSTRDAFESEYPDGARLAPYADGTLAVPLRAGGTVVGAMGFPFDRGEAIDDEVVSFAQLAADLGGQALERASLYEQERRSHEALDRITRLAPLFGSESAESVVEMVCKEALRTFESDVAHMWTIDGDSFDVLWREPQTEAFPPGSRVSAADYPGLAEAIERLEPMFIADSWTDVRGQALELARQLGIRSSLRVPVAVAGEAAHVLVLQWTRVLPAPSSSGIVLARRFADQAGLALEHAQRRVAQAAASQSADETRRLLDLTGALAAALEPTDVAAATLREAFRGLGASAGSVARLHGDQELEMLAVVGYPNRTSDSPNRIDLGADIPLCDAVRRNQIITMPSAADRARRYPGVVGVHTSHAAWMTLPLVAGGRVVGGLGVAFDEPRAFTDADREFGLALSRQAGQALERSSLLENEQAARQRAERMASDLAQLHALATALGRAGNPKEVTRIIGDQTVQGVGAESSGIYMLGSDRKTLSLLSVSGAPRMEDLVERRRWSIRDSTPIADAVRFARPVWLSEEEEWSSYSSAAGWRETGASAVGIVPLVVERTAIGALLVVFHDRAPSDEDRRFVETVARQAAQPLERVRLLEEERASRLRAERASQRLRRLQTVTESLAAAPTMAAVAKVMTREGAAVLAADGVLVHVRDTRGRGFRMLASSVAPETLREVLSDPSPDGSTPIGDAFVSGSVVELDGTDESVARFPGFTPAPDGSPFRSLLCVPLSVGGETVGVVTAGFGEARTFDDEDRRTASIIGRQCAQALERSRLFDEERIARARSDRLQELTTGLSGALTSEEVVDVFLRQAAPAIGADNVAIGLVDHDGRISGDAGWRGDHDWLPEHWIESPAAAQTPLKDAITSGGPLYFDDARSLMAAYPYDAGEGLDDHQSFAFVPLLAGRKPFAVTVLAWQRSAPLHGEERAFVEAFASQCGQALDRAQRYDTERTIAETLQRSVLPETLSSMEGATVAARYLPGTAAMDVGGDWFDTIPLPDGRLGFVVGDVVGKGVQAASTMAQLRNGMRALTLDSSDPAGIVTKMNRLLDGYADSSFATLAFLTVEPTTREAALVSAGHLPPLVLSPNREPRLLDGGRGLPLGVQSDATYLCSVTTLEPGSVIVLYTDGLVERRDRPLDTGLELLIESVRGVTADAEELVDVVIERLIGDAARGDDVAVLVVALDTAPLGTFSLRLPAERHSLGELRRSFERWLDQGGIAEPDRSDLTLATWEASANAIEHAQDPSEHVIEVEATLAGDRVRVAVSDTGAWREPSDRPDRGLGLHLIQALTTSLAVEPGPAGTRVVMERALSRERAGGGGAHAADRGGS